MKNGRIDINFVKEGTSEKDLDLFLGPLENEDIRFFIPNEKLFLAHFMSEAGVFPSVSQARKNGWDKLIPTGFNNL